MADRTIKLAIFDCDGTHIDSEMIAWSVESESVAGLGVTVSPIDLAQRYAGLSHPEIIQRLQREFAVALPRRPSYPAERGAALRR